MNEIIEQDDRYPEWLKAWNAKAAEIDQQIINFFSGRKEYNAGALDEATTYVRNWWDTQELSPAARTEYEDYKTDSARFRQRIQDRINRLNEKGKLNWKDQSYGAGH
jgi:hypothetical protein